MADDEDKSIEEKAEEAGRQAADSGTKELFGIPEDNLQDGIGKLYEHQPIKDDDGDDDEDEAKS